MCVAWCDPVRSFLALPIGFSLSITGADAQYLETRDFNNKMLILEARLDEMDRKTSGQVRIGSMMLTGQEQMTL